MKRIIYLLLIVLMSPIGVYADIDLGKAHNSISNNNELKVKSISIDYYKDTSNYESCMNSEEYKTLEEQSNYCLASIYRNIIQAHINKNVEKFEKIEYSVSSCDIKNNTCKIILTDGTNNKNKLEKDYNITFIGEYNEGITNKANKFVDGLKKEYYLADMSYINQLINYTNEHGIWNAITYDSSEILNIFPEFKSSLEKNADLDYVIVKQGVGSSHGLLGSGALIVTYYNDIAISISQSINYSTLQYVYVPDTTKDTDKAYIKAAKKRIKEYLSNDEYKVSITYDEKFDYCKMYAEDGICNISSWANDIFKDSKTYIAKAYKLTINGNEYFVGIVPVSKDKIIDLEVKSLNYDTGISISTKDSSVPLDTRLDIKDVTDGYDKDSFYKVYDINLYSLLKKGYINKIHNGVKVSIPILDGYDKDVIDIYHIKEDGSNGDKYEAKVEKKDGKKYAVFTTNHFSIYGIPNIEKEDGVDANPETNNGIGIAIIALIIVFLGIVLANNYINRKKFSS